MDDMDGMDDMDAGRVRPGHGRTRTNKDAAEYSGTMDTMDTMDERIQRQIEQLEREKAEFMLLAPVRADEKMQALHAQLQMEISMRIAHFELQIETLKGLLALPAKEIG